MKVDYSLYRRATGGRRANVNPPGPRAPGKKGRRHSLPVRPGPGQARGKPLQRRLQPVRCSQPATERTADLSIDAALADGCSSTSWQQMLPAQPHGRPGATRQPSSPHARRMHAFRRPSDRQHPCACRGAAGAAARPSASLLTFLFNITAARYCSRGCRTAGEDGRLRRPQQERRRLLARVARTREYICM